MVIIQDPSTLVGNWCKKPLAEFRELDSPHHMITPNTHDSHLPGTDPHSHLNAPLESKEPHHPSSLDLLAILKLSFQTEPGSHQNSTSTPKLPILQLFFQTEPIDPRLGAIKTPLELWICRESEY